jgi:aldose 1-epimerase
MEELDGHPTVVLRDGDRGHEAHVLPSVGANCIVYRLNGDAGPIDVLYPPDTAEAVRDRPSGFGIPILFPFPNRIENGRFLFDGSVHQLDRPADGGHTIHGFVLDRPWVVTATGASRAGGAWTRLQFRSKGFPEIDRQFPFPFEGAAIYRLQDGALTLEIEATNTGETDMPAGLGMHPYFPLPISGDGDRGACAVQMPAERRWVLRPDCIPTGEVRPVSGNYDLREPTPLRDLYYDDVWTDLSLSDGWSRCVYRDPAAGLSIAMEADGVFRELVLYAPEQRPVICFEPYTCTTDAVNLEERGIDSGLNRLSPGETLKGTMRIIPELA